MRNRILFGGLILAVALSAVVVGAYTLQLDTLNGAVEVLKWPPAAGNVQATFTWQINPNTNPNNVDTSGGSVEVAFQSAFATWTGAQVSGQSVTTFTVKEGPPITTVNDENTADCLNVVSFEPTSATTFSTGVVAQTFIGSVTHTLPYTYACGGKNLNGVLVAQITDTDVVFNPKYCFSTAQPPPTSLPACPSGPVYDLQAIGTHEIGHMLGLDHSGLGHATMFPFGDTGTSAQRTLGVDDELGEAFLYPNGNFATATGIVAGKVTLSSAPAFASHVVLLDSQTGIAVTDSLTAADGTYALTGVPPGTYNLIALPLSGIYTIGNFGLWTCGYASDQSNCTGVPSNPVNYSGTFF